MTERIPFRFAPIPDDMLWDPALPSDVLRLWAAIYRLTDRQGVLSIGQAELGKALGWSESTVRRHLRKAEKLGYLAVTNRGAEGMPNEYTAILQGVSKVEPPPSSSDRGGVSDLTDPSSSLERTTRDASRRSARSSSKRKTGFPSDWTPAANEGEIATRVGMTRETRRVEFDNFRDHHLARGTTMADWAACWRTWCRNWAKFGAKQAESVGDDFDARVLAGRA